MHWSLSGTRKLCSGSRVYDIMRKLNVACRATAGVTLLEKSGILFFTLLLLHTFYMPVCI